MNREETVKLWRYVRAACPQQAICNGNTRVRAQQTTGNAWAEDPGCYLTDAELGIQHEMA